MVQPLCQPGANHFIEKYLYDCIYTPRDGVGFAFGMASICFWLVAQLPQFLLNIQRQSVDALSSWFLAQWLLGDTLNLVGCIMTGSQLPTQTYTAAYFILADMAMMIQYIYYGALQRRRERIYARRMMRQQRHLHYMHSHDGPEAVPLATTPSHSHSGDEESGVSAASSNGHLQGSAARAGKHRSVVSRAFASIVLMTLVYQHACGGGSRVYSSGVAGTSRRLLYSVHLQDEPPEWAKATGVVLGWISSAFYLGSRTSQIYKNWSRKCTEGLSLAMFLCAISANVCYGLGILIRTYNLADLQSSGPWLLGSLGVVALDCVISFQHNIYPHDDGKDAQRTPLLVTTPANRDSVSMLEEGRRD